jgi:hypothetical protein
MHFKASLNAPSHDLLSGPNNFEISPVTGGC